MENTRKIIGHTGYLAMYPQNTMLAFNEAINAGVHGIETDVMLTSDGVWICLHASELSTRTTGSGIVNHSTWDYIKTLDVTWWFDQYYGREDNKVVSLEQLLDLVQGTDIEIELDLKQWQSNPYQVTSERVNEMTSLVNLIVSKDMLHQCIFLSAENICNEIRDNFPDVITGVYYYGTTGSNSEYTSALQNAINKKHNIVYWFDGTYDEYPNTYVTKNMVEAFKSKGIEFGVTTIGADGYYRTKLYDLLGVNRYLVDYIPDSITALSDGIDIGIILPPQKVLKSDVFYNGTKYDTFTNLGGEILKLEPYVHKV